jgi:hypothetical protein
MERPEHRILLACARVCSASERKELLASCLDENIDWEYLLQAAGLNGMTSLLYLHLNETSRDRIPESVLHKLESDFRNAAIRNLAYTAELLRVLDLLGTNGIEGIPFKGPVLAMALYEDPSARTFADLDILIRKQDVFKALGILPELGYQKTPDYAPQVQSQILKREYHCQLEKEGGRALLEIHWNVAPHYLALPLDIEGWWDRAERLPMETHQVPNLSCEDLLVALCAHGTRHMWDSLILLADIARLLDRHPGMNWDSLLRSYSHPDLRRVLFLGLLIVHHALAAPLPAEVLEKATGDPAVKALDRQIRAMLLGDKSKFQGWPSWVFQLKLKRSLKNRIRYVFRIVSTPTILEWNVRIPSFLFPIYFFMRPVRLLGKYLSQKFSRESGNESINK